MTTNNQLLKRIKGILLGGALGDAYGMPTEFWTYNQIKRKFPDGIQTLLPSLENQLIPRSLPAGSITDDTINTVMLLESIVKNQGKLNAMDYIKHLSEWISNAEDAKLVSGPSTLRAIQAIKEGASITKAGFGNTTNGAAMKISPIGLISDYRHLDELVKNVYEICLPTHNTSIAVSGASVVAACISYVAAGGKDIDEIWELAANVANESKGVGAEFPSPDLSFRIQYARDIVNHCSKTEAIRRIVNELGTGVETIETIPAVLAIVQLANGDPGKAAKMSASLGADTDTIGAISTSICGGINPFFDENDLALIEEVNGLDMAKLAENILPFSPYFV
ncbi:ADP-ribosylglycohydrolase family protein [Amphibacillus sediminis]|uniref:ADP-ribosylglycohydrolase family protein n=1 Tax=Amphibacillus sediminis TaxID=360185 RepID=UPI000834C369|nr:ADP-ribosylglycohydrolase family protein [Amphibacillus sediminis]